MKPSTADFRSVYLGIVIVCLTNLVATTAAQTSINITSRVRRDTNFHETLPLSSLQTQRPLIFPQQPPQLKNRQELSQQPPFYLAANTIYEPANIPATFNQRDTRFYDQFQAQNQHQLDGLNQEAPLDLGKINNRTPQQSVSTEGLSPHQTNAKQPKVAALTSASVNNDQRGRQMVFRAPNKNQDDGLEDTGSKVRRFDAAESSGWPAVKKGKVADVQLMEPRTSVKFPPNQYQPGQPTFGPFGNKLGSLMYKNQDCITRAAPLASRCEDHLIKRLNQDATEGRTVLDVGRRVCCALFWHKDCISRLVVDTCPDSSPVAGDILIGARRLDLTSSCKNFNRDG